MPWRTGPPVPDGHRDAQGLTSEEVRDRLARGQVNVPTADGRRTVGDIVRSNVVTRFNAILGTLLVVVLVTGEYRDALFGIVLVANTLIGIGQELRAKLTLDRLQVVSAPTARVWREGAPTAVPTTALVVDDLLEISRGDQLAVDATVVRATGLEADESLLTGEAEPVPKAAGDRVLSGSFVVSGSALVQASAVGDDAYAAQLAAQARRFATVRSELRCGIDEMLRVGTWLLLPAGVLLILSQVRTVSSLDAALRGSVAGVAAMVPEGLVLLTSIAFAAGVVRMSRRRALIQELAAVELLARVDVVCVDKTGTLTSGSLRVASITPVGGPDLAEARAALGALSRVEDTPDATLAALAAEVTDPSWRPLDVIAFSSARKWSGATFEAHGGWLLGAPEVLLPSDHELGPRVAELAADGLRVILLARVQELSTHLAEPCTPVALVALADRIRPEAASTVAYFVREGVSLKVISGDHPTTAAAVATAVGLPAGRAVDARTLPSEPGELADAITAGTVFGRVQPHQKRDIVEALQSRGHVVAMTGDGVNDVLALKQADLGVAMGSGSPASRAVAQVVLLDDSFASLPALLAEGRRVTGNIERVARLFVTKSVYAFLLAVTVGIARVPFPFFPRHLTIISSLTIGVPAFFLALAPNTRRYRPGFVGRVARFAVPAGVVAAAATFAGYAMATRAAGATLVQERTTALLVLFTVATWILVMLCRPLHAARLALVLAMAGVFVAILAVPSLRRFFELELPPGPVMLLAAAIAALAIAVLEVASHVTFGPTEPASTSLRSDRGRMARTGAGAGRAEP